MTSPRTVNRTSSAIRWAILIALLVLVAVVLLMKPGRPSAEELYRQALKAWIDRDYAHSEQRAVAAFTLQPNMEKAILLAARSAQKTDQPKAAARHFHYLLDVSDSATTDSVTEAGVFFLNRGELSTAEAAFRRALALDPAQLEANDRLAYLMRMTGRYFEAEAFHRNLIRQGRASADILIALAEGDTLAPNAAIRDWLQQCHADFPNDPLPLVGLAKAALFENQNEVAADLARQAIDRDNGLAAAWVILGQALLETNAHEQLIRTAWPQETSADRSERDLPLIESHPGTWFVRGRWLRSRNDLHGAARCLAETIRRSPLHRAATYQLLQVLQELNITDAVALAKARTVSLDQLADAVQSFHTDRKAAAIQPIANWMEAHSHALEAVGWASLSLHLDSRNDWAADVLRRVQQEGNIEGSEETPQALVAAAERFGIPDVGSAPDETTVNTSKSAIRTDVSFHNSAAEAGLNFRYVNSGNPAEAIVYIQESNGGGAGVIDFDNDGWPDLYFPQGGTWPPENHAAAPIDQLFRNRQGQHFRNVTNEAGLREPDFGQGVAVGDWNNDGFADVFVGNIGANRLFVNNGDGTFTDRSEHITGDTQSWTTSCLIADLNGDGLADLYGVNYLSGQDVFTRLCRGPDGKPGVCTPDLFDGAADEVFLNSGDGQFAVQPESRVAMSEGKGLGIVAFASDASPALNLFVANDQVPNFYFVNRSTDDRIAFEEHGIASGLALDRDGNGQACMGIAADDADGDGRIDLFVTNFHNESNTLYRSHGHGLFFDETQRAGLRDPSFALLGFGTQFLDADMDGQPDLVVANGHVKRSSDQTPYRMRPQFFQNLDGRFQEVPAEILGPWFQQGYLGRALATLDWNRDGLPDFVTTSLDAPVALLTNRSIAAGHFLAVSLRGVDSSRDAIGTSVRVRAGNRMRVRQLTAGDGFQACNQRQIIFGLADNKQIDEVSVSWPSGLQQTFHNLSVDSEILIIEGRPTCFSRQ